MNDGQNIFSDAEGSTGPIGDAIIDAAKEAAGITLVAVARHDGFEMFTHPQRIEERAPAHVA